MPAGEIHLSDFGTQFQFTIRDQDSNIVDVSNSSIKQVTFLVPPGVILNPLFPANPNNNTFTRNLGFLTDGTDGICTYTIQSGELNTPGLWAFQCFVVGPSGAWNSDVTQFRILENLYIGSP